MLRIERRVLNMNFPKIFAAVLLATTSTFAMANASQAADAVTAEAPVASGFNWSGLYVGFGGGVGAVERKTEITDGVDSAGLPDFGGDGVFAEVTAGYDHMVSERVLLGGFIDAHVGNIAFSFGDLSLKNKYGFDVAARAGYLLTPNTLGYVLGGYTWQRIELDVPGAILMKKDRDGYVLGVGLETAISGNWTLKSEYRYANYGNNVAIEDLGGGGAGPALKFEPSTHTFHVGANYRFGAQNGGGASFAAPAYSWTGFYVGGALGAVAKIDEIDGGALDGIGGQGAYGELSVGYDREFNGIWVAGLQVDGRYSGLTTQMMAMGGDSVDGKTDYGFDVVARVGAKLNESTLAYVLGGYSWQHFTAEGLDAMSFPVDKIDWSSSGFSIGGGLETAVTNNVAVNLEYRYSRYQSEALFDGSWETTPSFHSVRAGAKYKFN
ncbi:outer membrane protein [Mesorhizobium sp. ANAO-SY3R2]|uniref:outer membrane protein n=1 Tax=Mesorhizobium sp. ANAO-SY3R2 TaxID=3166644 RepID=UPI00366A8607